MMSKILDRFPEFPPYPPASTITTQGHQRPLDHRRHPNRSADWVDDPSGNYT
jgi:hypothetical protein